MRLRVPTILDVVLAPVLVLGLLAGKVLRRLGTHNTPLASRIYDLVGVLPVLNDYYEPLVVPTKHLARSLDEPRPLPGLDLRTEEQLALVAELSVHRDELAALPMDPVDGRPHYLNDAYSFGDAEVLYAMVRHLRPRRFVEVGSGHSTRFVREAAQRNIADGSPSMDHICVEPYEMPWLEGTGVRVVRERVEVVGRELFRQLEAGDVLFIDSSHVIRPQGDVVVEYLEILPSLRPGVLVHVHDVFTPRDYPDHWVRERRRLWGEQYLLEALLTDSDRWEIVLALNHLANDHPDQLGASCPKFSEHGGQPGAMWIRRR